VRTTDVSLLNEIILRSQYEWQLPRSPRVIVDAGANIGLASIYYANKYPNAQIISLEPAPSNLILLRKNMANYSNSAVVAGALWKHDGHVRVVDPGTGEWGFQVAGEANNGDIVAAFSIDTLMKTCGVEYIDLLKVDIEGAEKEVFENPSNWIDRVGAIAVELHDFLRDGCSRTFYQAIGQFDFQSRRGETIFVRRAA
jgi:FkbM family methyltransferase